MQDHYDWYRDTYNIEPSSFFTRNVLTGGDLVEDFVARCRQNGLAAIVSMRLNDQHHLDHIDDNPPPSGRVQNLTQFYYDHPEYRLGPNLSDSYQRVLNWAIPQVRQRAFDLLEELCENYDIDGLELDFMRHCNFFQMENTTSAQRQEIMTHFISDIRRVLNRTSAPGQHRWLSARLPAFVSSLNYLGLDPVQMADAGVDMFNLSSFYHTYQQNDMAQFKAVLPNDTELYYEVTHVVGVYPDSFGHRLMADNMFYTAAHLAYEDGADGISAFNFVYYRLVDIDPPFHVFNHMADKDWIAQQPQHYAVGHTYNHPKFAGYLLPLDFSQNTTKTVALRMAPPTGGWTTDGRLRIQSLNSMGTTVWQASINNVILTPTGDVSEPYGANYDTGNLEDYRAWIVPKATLIDGMNSLEIKMTSSGSERIIYFDIAIQ